MSAKNGEIVKKDAAKVAEAAQPGDEYGGLVRIAVEKDFDVDRLAKLLELKEHEEAKQAKKAFVKALAEFQSRCPPISKLDSTSITSRRTGETHGYNYAKLERILRIVTPLMHDVGLTRRYSYAYDDNSITVTCVLTHLDGHSEETSLHGPIDNSGSKNAIQGRGSTVKYLERYTLTGALGIVEDGLDDDAQTVDELITDDQRANLEALIAKAGVELEGVLTFGECPDLHTFPVAKYRQTIDALRARIKTAQAAEPAPEPSTAEQEDLPL